MGFLTNTKNKKPLGIYVHVPFCRSKCQYCDFYSLTCKDDKSIETYIRAICDHIKESGPLTPGYKVDTIYFGGGTPSFLGADALATILTTIRRVFDVDPNAEIMPFPSSRRKSVSIFLSAQRMVPEILTSAENSSCKTEKPIVSRKFLQLA